MQHKAPMYTTDCCIHTSDIARRQHLRSAGCHQLIVPRHRRSTFGRRAFSVAGLAACNSLPDYLRDPSRSADSFRRDLKTSLFSFYWCTRRIRGFAIVRYINPLLTLTLTFRAATRSVRVNSPLHVYAQRVHCISDHGMHRLHCYRHLYSSQTTLCSASYVS